MAQVLINDTTLTGIADAMRNTTGSTATMKPSEIKSTADTVASEVASQAGLLEQITTLLNEKINAGGGGGVALETSEVSFSVDYMMNEPTVTAYYTAIGDDGSLSAASTYVEISVRSGNRTVITCPKNTCVIIVSDITTEFNSIGANEIYFSDLIYIFSPTDSEVRASVLAM